MRKAIQQRTLETRDKLIATAKALVAESSFEALRTDEVVRRAGVAKGTFFAHFADRDSLMELLIGERINQHLDTLAAGPAPAGVDALVQALQPLLDFMASERHVFDIILRRSGAAAAEDIGPIAWTLDRLGQILAPWLTAPGFRQDVPPDILAEGIQAFALQTLALNFCALHADGPGPLVARLGVYLRAWLVVPGQA